MAEIEQDIVSRVILTGSEIKAITDNEAQRGGPSFRMIAEIGRKAGMALCDDLDYNRRRKIGNATCLRITSSCGLEVETIGETEIEEATTFKVRCREKTCVAQAAPCKAALVILNSVQTITETMTNLRQRRAPQE